MQIKEEKGRISIADLILLVILVLGVMFIFEYIIPKNKTSEGNAYNSYEANSSITSDTNITNINVNEVVKNSYQRYFYEQLSNNGKIIYDTLINNIDTFKQGYGKIEIEINEKGVEKEFQSAWDALCLDRVDIFYVDTEKLSFTIQTSTNIFGKSNYKYFIQPKNDTFFSDCWNSKYDVQNAINNVEARAQSVINKMVANTRYEKVKYIHDYLVDNMEYNQEKSINNSNIYGALIERKAVCEGYAETFKYFMDKLGIPCILVYGNGIDNEGESQYHSWNQVLMDDNQWYSVDTTWDDPILIGYGKLPEKSKYKYFLKGSQEFDSSHVKEHDVSGTGQHFEYTETAIMDYGK